MFGGLSALTPPAFLWGGVIGHHVPSAPPSPRPLPPQEPARCSARGVRKVTTVLNGLLQASVYSYIAFPIIDLIDLTACMYFSSYTTLV